MNPLELLGFGSIIDFEKEDSMSRVEENAEMIRQFDEEMLCVVSITGRILMDISKSLAVIADSMSREDGEKKE